MADDHNALLAWTDALVGHLRNQPKDGLSRQHLADIKASADAIDDLAAELRALTSRHHTARALIAYLADLHDYHTGALPHMAEGPDLTAEQVALYESVMADQAKDPDHE